MKRKYVHWSVFSVFQCIAAFVFAADSSTAEPVTAVMENRALSAAQLSAIRGVSRTVLAAKKSGAEDAADLGQLNQLRGALERLIAAEFSPAQGRIALEHDGRDARAGAERNVTAREALQFELRSMVSQLRNRSQRPSLPNRIDDDREVFSSGMPIRSQRSEMFERWTSALDTALAGPSAERTALLLGLHQQLVARKGSVNEVPRLPGTPTLQVQRAGDPVPPTARNTTDVKQ